MTDPQDITYHDGVRVAPDPATQARIVAGVVASILVALERDIWPRLGYDGRDGYDCCGCSSTGRMYDDVCALVSREGLNALPPTTEGTPRP